MLYVVIDWETQSIELLRWLDTSRSRRNVRIPILILFVCLSWRPAFNSLKLPVLYILESYIFCKSQFNLIKGSELHYYETKGREGQLPNWVTMNGRSWVFAFSGALEFLLSTNCQILSKVPQCSSCSKIVLIPFVVDFQTFYRTDELMTHNQDPWLADSWQQWDHLEWMGI